MTAVSTIGTPENRTLRLWPGFVLAIVLIVSKFLVPLVLPNQAVFGMLGALVCGLLIILWWLFFSRAAWAERLGGLALMALAVFATRPFLHDSIDTAGMGLMFPIVGVPIYCLALVVWAAATRNITGAARWWTMIGAFMVVSFGWTQLRTGGITNDGNSDFAWRWSPTAEERLLAAYVEEAEVSGARARVEGSVAEWPGFRGANRDGVIRGVRIETDWAASPPVEKWRRPIGPGWSSFAVHGDVFYTQEQRGDFEVVGCYDVDTGEAVWQHRDATRFWESNAGAGPRSTPTLSAGRVYTSGATGILNALDAGDGSLVWTRNAAADLQAEVPIWGFSGSPVATDDLVITALEGVLAAYDLETGEPRWVGPSGGNSYSSPHLLTLEGVPQVVLMSQDHILSVAPADGAQLWLHEWKGGGTRIVQPAVVQGGDLLLSQGNTTGLRRVSVAGGSTGWATEERWTTHRLKPYFSDFVVHQGHAYGFDGNILASIDIENGERNWKGGRYGSGQMVLLADQDLLLVISEKGELALVSATPDRFSELARLQAIAGKTWNHPVLVRDLLLVRNSEEMAAFRLSLVGS